MVNYKLIALDLDGTLLNDEKIISERAKIAVQQLSKKGVKFVLATGRGPQRTIPLAVELGIAAPVIVYNGGCIIDFQTNQIVQETGYYIDEMAPVIEYCRSRKLDFTVNTLTGMYIENDTEYLANRYARGFYEPVIVNDVMKTEEKVIKVAVLAQESILNEVEEYIRSLTRDKRLVRSGEDTLDIVHPSINKGAALACLAGKYGIPLQEVAAFGNYFNDLEMIKLAGLGVAMENSPDRLKAVADKVTVTNNEDGVALILEQMSSEAGVLELNT